MKTLITQLLLLIVLIAFLNVNAQNSPAGIGNDYELNLWLSAEDVSGIDDGDLLSTAWIDRSGKGHNASQSNASYQPTFHESVINGHPVVRFDGNNDFLDDLHNYDARSVFIVFQTRSTLQSTSDLAQLWGSYGDGVHVAVEARTNGDHMGFSFDGVPSSGNRARYAINASTLTGFAINSNLQKWNYDKFEIVAVEFEHTQTLNRQVLGSLFPSFGIGVHQFGGDIAEVIVFKDPVGPTQRALVENYLSSKYHISISNDLYAYDFNHGFDVAGIGRATSANKQSEALSAGILGLKKYDVLAVNDYALLGHDNASVDSWTSSGTPGGYTAERLNRVWRVDLSGAIGKTKIILDTSDIPAKSTASMVWAVLISNNGNFATNSEIHLLKENAGKYESESLQLNDGEHITIAAVAIELDFAQQNFSAIESEDSINVRIKLNLPLYSDVNFTFETIDSTAISPDDYESINALYTIPAGDTIIEIGIKIVNDTIVEPSEHIILKLIPEDLNLFEEKTALATIHDDDNPRKLSFQYASMSGSESVGSVNVNVVLNNPDSVNTTTVKFRVIGGTATKGVDYTINEGTLSFAPFSENESFEITVIDDDLYELNETIIIELYEPTNSNLSDTDPIVFTYTIEDNDPMPNISFPIIELSKMEANKTVKIPVELSAASGLDMTYEFNLIGGTATLGSDFTFTPGTSVIVAGNTTDTILLQIIDDEIIELDETVIISISALSGAQTGSDSIFTLTIIDNDVFGYTGPGGVGDSVLNSLWLDAGSISGIASGNSINTNWPDRSGNLRNASQSNAAYQPSFIDNEINGLPVVRFNGSNDFFDNSYDYDVASGIIVMKVNSTLQSSNDLGQVFGNYSQGHFAFEARNGGNHRGVSFDGGTSKRGKFRINGGNYTPYAMDTNAEQWEYDEYFIISGNFEDVINFNRMVIGSLYPSFNVGQHQFGGEVAEIILFQNRLNDAQLIIIENYLSSKYDIAIAQDYFSFDASHGHDVIGIGMEDNDNTHIRSKSADILMLSNPVGFGDGDYIFAGHDNGDISAWESSNTPNASTMLLERTWMFDVSDTTSEMSINIDTTMLPDLPSGFVAWTLVVNDDSDFSYGSTYHLLEMDINGKYRANNVKINTGNIVAIAAVKNISARNGYFGETSSWVAGIPSITDTVIIAAYHTITLNENEESAHLHVSRHSRLKLENYTFKIGEGSMEINGMMDMGTGTVSYSSSGDQNIAAISYYNLKIEGNGTKTLRGNTVVEGNLIIDTATLDANNSGNYTLQLVGNWINNGGSFIPRNAVVDLNGVTAQNITSNGGSFYTLRVSGSGPYELQDDATLEHELILDNGVVSTHNHTLKITNTAGSALSTYSSNSFINGNLERAVGNGFHEYIFPVGNGTNSSNYHPAEIVSYNLLGVSNITTYFTDIERHNDLDMDVSDTWIDYQSVSPDGMWVITPNQQPTAGLYNVKLYLENMTGLFDNKFAIIKREEGASDATAWTAMGNINSFNGIGRKLSDGYALRMGLNSFSEFALGSGTSDGVPLPVEMLYFEAYKKDENVELHWVTATEINSESFKIQRSADANKFETIGILKAQGNSMVEVKYYFTDERPLSGDNYYRLKQVDLDGQYEILPVKHLYFKVRNNQVELVVYPNPSDGKHLNINVSNIEFDIQDVSLNIFDNQGKRVFENIEINSENNLIELNNELSPGIYILDIRVGKSSQQVKWIIN